VHLQTNRALLNGAFATTQPQAPMRSNIPLVRTRRELRA
jgi:hypothetical protein